MKTNAPDVGYTTNRCSRQLSVEQHELVSIHKRDLPTASQVKKQFNAAITHVYVMVWCQENTKIRLKDAACSPFAENVPEKVEQYEPCCAVAAFMQMVS